MPEAQTIPDVPFRIIVKTLTGDDGGLCCPICGCEHVHPEQVTVEQGDTRTVVTGERTEVRTSSRRFFYRGSLIGLAFWCEDGHSFRYDLAFYKGRVHLRLSAGRRMGPFQTSELWRD